MLCTEAKASIVGFTLIQFKTASIIGRATDHSSVDVENLEPKSANCKRACSLGV